MNQIFAERFKSARLLSGYSLQDLADKLENEKKAATEKLNDTTLNHQQLTELGKRIEEITHELDTKTARWLELDELLNT